MISFVSCARFKGLEQTVLMGKEAFKLLLQLVENKDLAVQVKQKIVLEPIPIFRESSERNLAHKIKR